MKKEFQMTLYLNELNFNQATENGVVLVDFFAEWCGPCKALSPVIDELASEFEGKASITKVNVDENSNIAAQFGVRGIPTVVILKNGKLEKQLVGVHPKNIYEEELKKIM
jgi:thioredoxin 1